jgi:SEC-C motif domain protein
MRCPCGFGLLYNECCGPFHAGAAMAPTAERLMRSRFSAFALGNASYLLSTWHPSTRPHSVETDDDVRWYRLDIDGREAGGPFDAEGTVTFTAWYRSPDGPGALHERSRFRREDGTWFYLDGVTSEPR